MRFPYFFVIFVLQGKAERILVRAATKWLWQTALRCQGNQI